MTSAEPQNRPLAEARLRRNEPPGDRGQTRDPHNEEIRPSHFHGGCDVIDEPVNDRLGTEKRHVLVKHITVEESTFIGYKPCAE